MPKANDQVAAAFEELADLVQISGGDRFKVLAYRRVAEELRALAKDLSTLEKKQLLALKGVGKATAEMIIDLVSKGTTPKLEDARALVPPGVRDMTAVSGLGPKKAFMLYNELGIATLDDLRDAVKNHKLRDVKGLGEKTEQNLSRALDVYTKEEKRVGLEPALLEAEKMVAGLMESDAVSEAAFCGSLRRMKETIGDLDLLAAGEDQNAVMEAFKSLPEVESVVLGGSTKTSVITSEGLQIDLRVVAPAEFGSALQYFTGSKEHNVRVREIAVKKGYKLSEYGLFNVKDNDRVAGHTEEEIYSKLGMQTPPATMRENRGEIELALTSELPDLVQVSDIRGDLHSHTNYSDGVGEVRQMVLEAAGLGYAYYAVTDHARSHHVKSHDTESLQRQKEEIYALNEELSDMRVLQGVELDIGPDGELEELDGLINELDVVVASVHSSFGQDPKRTTERIITALNHPQVNILGHPTGRRIGTRPPLEFDMEAVFSAAAQNNVALEINSTPQRLDLKDDHIRLARECGCVFSIDTDSHAPQRLGRIRLGVAMAQRGWATPDEIINCRPLAELEKFLAKS